MNEKWKNIPGFENKYQVSDTGIVRSLPRIVDRGTKGLRKTRLKIISQSVSNTNSPYKRCTLFKNSVRHYKDVHVLVALAFIGPRPHDHEIHHIDGNRLNNNLSNIAYLTIAEHRATRNMPKGSQHPNSVLTEQEVIALRQDHKSGLTYKQLGVKYGVSTMSSWRIARRKAWTHI